MPLRLRWLCLLLLLGCLDTFAPAGAVVFTPPAAYGTWWAEIESCAGISGDFAAIKWYEVPGSSYSCPAYEGECAGWWQPPHTIYLAETRANDPTVVAAARPHPHPYTAHSTGGTIQHSAGSHIR